MYQVIIVSSQADANACLDAVREAQGFTQMAGHDWFAVNASDGSNTYAVNKYPLLHTDLLPLQNSNLVYHSGYYDTLDAALVEAKLTRV